MCIVAIAHLASDRYPLIVAANRDERHDRPSAAADWWGGPGSLLAGRDLAAGGTWLGVTSTGRFAAVTNVFEGGTVAPPKSRGALVTGFLRGKETPSEFAAACEDEGSLYGPFNLVLRSGDALYFVSNRNSSTALGVGIHVFSNNAPGLQWSKVGALADAIDGVADRDDPAEFLIGRLSGPKARGPLERAADSLFVVGETFGTRCTTVLTVDSDGRAAFVEQRFGPGGDASGRSEFTFDIAA
ncbi:MAG TPA: NRDE family protein [Gammaproteobacteria bacterium]|nr:NRDE family protein [Gammaproteobacteria bacterium]